MSLRINHNISSINGHRQLMKNEGMMAKSLERLSSGLKINRAADDAAGLVISEQMRAQISGLKQGIDNSETAISMVQTSEGALDEVNSLLTKARELTLHAANEGANDVNQLVADQTELDNVIQSITRISDVTQFGTKKLLDGSLNGAKDLATGISHVKVGNLANNPGITAGKVTLNVTAATQEAMTLAKSGSSTDSYIFNGAVTGVKMGTKSVVSGVSVVLNLNTGSVSYVTTGTLTASALAAKLDTLANSKGFDVSATTGGEIKVTKQAYGATDFTAGITFSRAATPVSVGTKESITSTLKVTSPSTNSGAASLIFNGLSKISGLQSTSVAGKTGTKLSYVIDTATGGSFAGTVTGNQASGTTVAKLMSGLQTKIRAHGAGFSGATLSLVGGVASGIQFKLTRGADTVATDFNFSLTIDYKNNASTKSEAHTLNLAASTFTTGGNNTFITGAATGAVQGNALVGASRLASGNAINLTISGQTVTANSGTMTLTAAATALQTKIQALGAAFANVRVAFATGGSNYSGLAGQVGITGAIAAGFRGFVVYNTDGKDMNVSLAIDQKQGNDVGLSGTETKAGLVAGATLDLTTTSQTRTSNVATVAAIAASTVSSTSTASTVSQGTDATATMTSANGVTLNLKQSAVTSEGNVIMKLTTGSVALGYKDFSAELSSTLQTAGGQTNFTLTQGAVFQVGANALQQVAFTIEDTSAGELGRGASSTLASLEDMLSTKEGALVNGLTEDALAVIDAAIDEVTNLRGRLGAFQANALESGLNSLRVSYENLTAAESTIRDVDFAEESANFTRNQILVQASTSMLAQANQMPQNVLKLLG